MAEVIKPLEDTSDIQEPERFTPRAEQAALLAECVWRFNAAPAARWRAQVVLGFFAGCVLPALLGTLFGWWRLTGAVAALAVLTPLCHVVIDGVARRTYLFGKVRELVRASSWIDRLVALVAGGLLLLLLFLFHALGLALACVILAASLAVGFYILIDRPVAARREEPVKRAQELLRGMRLHGFGEEPLREFVRDASGEDWEPFYEALFGYEALVAARAQASPGRSRFRHEAWRDPVVAWVEARLRARRAAREQDEAAATAQVHPTAAIQEGTAPQPLPVAIPLGPDGSPDLPPVQQLLGLPDPAPPVPAGRRRRRALRRFFNHAFESLLGPKVRFLVGAVLLAGCIGWVYQNDLIPGQEIWNLAGEALERLDVPDLSGVNIDLARPTRPLSLPLVPAALTDVFDGFTGGAAALILFLSMVFRGWRVAVFAWPAAVVAFAGHRLGIPALEPLSGQAVSMIAGAVLLVPGLVLAARKVY
jgi:hypothetical protein